VTPSIRRAGPCAALLALAAAHATAGEPAVDVSLRVDPCVEVDVGAVERLFFLELGTSPPRPVASTATRPHAAVDVGCAGADIEVRVEDPLTGKSLARRMARGLRAGRERLIALAAVELLVASWIELEAASDRTPDPALGKARRDAQQLVAGRLSHPRWTTTTSLIATAGRAGVDHAGGGVRLERDTDRWGWSAEIAVWVGSQRVALGDVAAAAISGALAGHLSLGSGPIGFRAGAGARIAQVSLTGEPSPGSRATGDQVTGVAAGPFARAGAVWRAGRAALSLTVEAGYHLAGVRGTVDGAPATAVTGSWLAGQLGVGWVW